LQLLIDNSMKAGYISSHMTLAEKLKKLRKKNKLSMSQVARISELAPDHRGGITQGYLSRLESGKENNPSLMKLMTLCSIYMVEPNDLLVIKSLKKPRKTR
jgi:transcriptional regulator with XRE-family HTH domain